MSRALYPDRDTMRVVVGITVAKWAGTLVLVAACTIAPDALVSLATGGWG